MLTAVSTYGARGSSSRVRILDWVDWCKLPTTVVDYIGTGDNSPKSLLRHPVAVVQAELRLRRLAARPGDRLLVGRAASPFSSGRIEAELLARWRHSAYDFDDAIYERGDRLYGRVWSKSAVWRRAVEAAAVVIAGSAHLADRASVFSRSVVMIPSCVDVGEFEAKVDYNLRSEHPVAVWIGSPSTESFLMEIQEHLLRLHSSLGLRLRVISAGNRSLGPLDQMIDRVEWDSRTFASHLVDADIGIMPLPDNELTRGKCAYKLLQYGAVGLPVVGSPVGANVEVLEKLGGSAPVGDDWFFAMEGLLAEPSSVRAERGRAARRGTAASYSFEVWEPAWRRAIGV